MFKEEFGSTLKPLVRELGIDLKGEYKSIKDIFEGEGKLAQSEPFKIARSMFESGEVDEVRWAQRGLCERLQKFVNLSEQCMNRGAECEQVIERKILKLADTNSMEREAHSRFLMSFQKKLGELKKKRCFLILIAYTPVLQMAQDFEKDKNCRSRTTQQTHFGAGTKRFALIGIACAN